MNYYLLKGYNIMNANNDDIDNPVIIMMNLNINGDKEVQFELRLLDDVQKSVRSFSKKHKIPQDAELKLLDSVLENRIKLMDELEIDEDMIDAGQSYESPARGVGPIENKNDSLQTAKFNDKKFSPEQEHGYKDDPFARIIDNQIAQASQILKGKSLQNGKVPKPNKVQNYGKERTINQSKNDKVVDLNNKHYPSATQSNKKIYDRLYVDGLMKNVKRERDIFNKKVYEEHNMMANQIGRGKQYSDHIVNRLYYKGSNDEQRKRIELEKMKSLKDYEEQAECTHKPKVSRLSELIAERKLERKSKPIEDFLIEEGANRARKLEQASSVKIGHELSELQEKPFISQLSREIAMEKSRAEGKAYSQVHNNLYEDSIQRKNRSIVYEHNILYEPLHAFKPEERLVQDKHWNSSMLERLSKYSHEREKKIMLKKAQLTPPLKQMINPDTNMPYFHPLTGRSPSNRSTTAEDVGRYLHDLCQITKDKIDKKREAMYSRDNMVTKATEKSQTLIESKKAATFRRLFAVLDSDKDGVISADKVNIENIEEEALKYISPLLINMEELNMEIDEQTFVYGMEEIYKKLSVAERSKLIIEKKKGFSDPECTFAPNLNETSLKIASGKKSIMESVDRITMMNKHKLKQYDEESGEDHHLGRIKEEQGESRSGVVRRSGEGNVEGLIENEMTFQPKLTLYKPENSCYVKQISRY